MACTKTSRCSEVEANTSRKILHDIFSYTYKLTKTGQLAKDQRKR